MADTKELMYAKEAFNTLCTTLNNIGWTYDKNEESLKIDFWVKTDDLPMRFLMIVDADKQLVRIYSPLPFKANPDKRVELITAITIINYSLADGTFMCELDDGSIIFKITSSFKESLLGEELFKYMVTLACTVVDKYNDQLESLHEGRMTLGEFIEKNN